MAENKDTVLGPIKRKIKNKALKESSKGSVKLVAPTSDSARANKNIQESLRLHNARFGTKDIRAHAERNITKGPTVSIRSTPGIAGKGGANVGGLYKPMGGGGMNWQNK